MGGDQRNAIREQKLTINGDIYIYVFGYDSSNDITLTTVTSGKHTKNYGISPFYSWVYQLFIWAIFNSKLFVYQRVNGNIKQHM